jgi:hypothetical protein
MEIAGICRFLPLDIAAEKPYNDSIKRLVE